MLILTWIRRIYKILSKDGSPAAIAFAAAFGLTAGFLPPTAGLTILLILLVLLIRVQISTAIAFWAIGSLVRLPASGLFAWIGERLLEAEPLRAFWKWFVGLPVVAWLDLDYYAVLGGAVAGVLLGGALFEPLRRIVIAYRAYAKDRLEKSKFFRWLMRLWIFRLLRFVFVGTSS
ncbi:MAG: TIGR03546 family protein [Planctomycetes bacterium]|nr:TIGR03546 family protein [Planctomycetota bacterium]